MKKRILFELLLGILLIAGTGCDNKVELNNDQSVKSEEIVVEAWKEAASDFDLVGYLDDIYGYRMFHMDGLSRTLNIYLDRYCLSGEKNNEFILKFQHDFSNSTYEKLSQKEKDFFSAYGNFLMMKLSDYDLSSVNDIVIKKVWAINYKNDKIDVETCNGKEIRGFIMVVNLDDREAVIVARVNYSFREKMDFGFQWLDETYSLQEFLSKSYDISLLDETGNISTYFCDEYEDKGIPSNSYYNLENLDTYSRIIEDNSSFFSFLREFGEIYKTTLIAREQSISNGGKVEEPKPGMSASEVKGSTWGYPDKINRDTYSWGTKEQWVYSRGYIYFQNGIVTSISER